MSRSDYEVGFEIIRDKFFLMRELGVLSSDMEFGVEIFGHGELKIS